MHAERDLQENLNLAQTEVQRAKEESLQWREGAQRFRRRAEHKEREAQDYRVLVRALEKHAQGQQVEIERLRAMLQTSQCRHADTERQLAAAESKGGAAQQRSLDLEGQLSRLRQRAAQDQAAETRRAGSFWDVRVEQDSQDADGAEPTSAVPTVMRNLSPLRQIAGQEPQPPAQRVETFEAVPTVREQAPGDPAAALDAAAGTCCGPPPFHNDAPPTFQCAQQVVNAPASCCAPLLLVSVPLAVGALTLAVPSRLLPDEFLNHLYDSYINIF